MFIYYQLHKKGMRSCHIFLEDFSTKRFLIIRERNILLLRWSDLEKGIYPLYRNLNQMLVSNGRSKCVVAHRSHEGNQENSFQWRCHFYIITE